MLKMFELDNVSTYFIESCKRQFVSSSLGIIHLHDSNLNVYEDQVYPGKVRELRVHPRRVRGAGRVAC